MQKEKAMTYQQAVEFAQKATQYGIVPGLGSIRRLMGIFGDAQDRIPAIHVAGTNGKGSVCAFLSAALTEAGYRVGRFHSPAVFSRREVFRIGEEMIGEEAYAGVMDRVRWACEQLVSAGHPHPTSFEVETAAAFLWFCENHCDLILLEAGMGGAMDATNLIASPLCSALTSISLDHRAYLGDTVGEIAKAKAGIIKKGCPVVALRQNEAVNQAIEERARQMGAPCAWVDERECEVLSRQPGRLLVEHPRYGRIETTLSASYQAQNLAVALGVLEVLETRGFPVSRGQAVAGIQQARWPGRYEILGTDPYFVIDGAHNAAAVLRLRESIEKDFTNRKIIYIIGVLKDKEHLQEIGSLIQGAEWAYAVTPDSPRALDGELLAGELRGHVAHAIACPKVEDAVDAALEQAGSEGVVVAFGSLSYLGEAKRAFFQKKKNGKDR